MQRKSPKEVVPVFEGGPVCVSHNFLFLVGLKIQMYLKILIEIKPLLVRALCPGFYLKVESEIHFSQENG